MPTLVVFGATAGLMGTYMTSEWIGKNILQYVPGYNTKYEAIKYARNE